MEWDDFWRLMLQLVIGTGVFCIAIFVVTAVVVAIKEGIEERK